jgi:DNA processing protein
MEAEAMREISTDAQAILLLANPLGQVNGPTPVSQSEYNEIARSLHEAQMRPGALLSPETAINAKDKATSVISAERLDQLLERQLLLATELTKWQALDIWVVTRGDAEYPSTLRSRMQGLAPMALFGIGDPRVLEAKGLGVVGSRNVSEEGAEFAAQVGRHASSVNIPIVSGGARGVDRAAMSGAIDSGGIAIGFVSDSLDRHATSSDTRSFIEGGQLTLVSQVEPSQRFLAWRAMDRNKLIYAQSFATLVVETDFGKGGTWNGAREQLKRFNYCDVYIRNSDPLTEGRVGLERLGAKRWAANSGSDILEMLNSGDGGGLETTIPPEQLTLEF